MSEELRISILSVLRDVPAPITQGTAANWGPQGNKTAAIYAAARLGHTFDPNCTSCDHDLYSVLRHAVK